MTGLIMVNYKFFCHIRASYFSFNTFLMNLNVIDLNINENFMTFLLAYLNVNFNFNIFVYG